jgi:hypothetical protein
LTRAETSVSLAPGSSQSMLGLPGLGVVMPAAQPGDLRGRGRHLAGHPPDRRDQLGNRVLGGYRIGQDGGVDRPAPPPGHGLGDPGGVVWGRWLGAGRFELGRPSSSAIVRLGSFAQRSRCATTSGTTAARATTLGPCRQEKNFSCRGCTRRPMGHLPGPTTCTAVRGAPPLHEKGVSRQRST